MPKELSAPLPDIHTTDDLLFDAVMKKASPAAVINDLYKVIHRPIIAFDTSFRLIAYAFPRPFYYEPWEEIASTENLSDEYIYKNNALFYQEQMYHLRCSSYFSTDIVEQCPQVDGPIFSDGKLIGYVGICVASDDEVETLSYINDRLSETLALLVPMYTDIDKENLNDGLAEKFLGSDSVDISEVSQMEIHYPPSYRIAILTAESGQIPTLKYVKGHLDRSGDTLYTYIDRNEQLVVLYYDISSGNSNLCEDSIIEKFSEYADKYQMYGGISDKFHHLTFIPSARLQANLSIEIGLRRPGGSRIFSFRRLFEDILCAFALERYGLYPATPPVLRFEDDRDKLVSLFPTLETYFECDCSKEKTAAKMGVHKNTIAYRLRQFMELTNADPNDTSAILQIKIGMMIHRYSELLGNNLDKTERRNANDKA